MSSRARIPRRSARDPFPLVGLTKLLDEYRVQFPDAQLAQEAANIRVEALLELGDRVEAEQMIV